MIEQSVLENRIRVVTRKLEGVRSISLGFLMTSGPMDEPEARSGVAHLAEHLVFSGTHTRDDAAIAAIIAIASKIANTFFISVPPLFFHL